MNVKPTLRLRLKQETRQRIERAALQLLAKQGYAATSVEQIVQLAGTTRTTFYDHFGAKSDLIGVVQAKKIAPALTELCARLDAEQPLTRTALRNWLDEYAGVWKRIRVYFDAYSDASRTDPAVAASILPNSYLVTGHLRRFLASFDDAERDIAHDKLILLFNDLDHLMHITELMRDRTAPDRMFEAFTDLYWQVLFNPAMRGRRARAAKSGLRRSVAATS